MKKKDIITKNSHSLCYFTPSKKQGRRNFWANGLIGPPKFYHYQKKWKKPIKCGYFMTCPKKLLAFRRPCRDETKSALLII